MDKKNIYIYSVVHSTKHPLKLLNYKNLDIIHFLFQCEWLARVDFRHESVRQKIDYTRPRPKSLREKPGFCARHRPYVVGIF